MHVVIIAKTTLRTQARAHVVLFSSDLDLAYAPLVDYYGLRFQIECNFRDAKQYWGLEDFMNVTPAGVTNAAKLSLFMVNVAYRLRVDIHSRDPAYSVLDLKADCRGYKYVEETIKMLPEKRYCPSFSLMDFIRQGKQGLDLGQLIRELSWYPIG